MKKYLVLIILGTALFACSNETLTEEVNTISYPETKKVDASDEYFGTVVNDPYRWLENDTASDTEAWVVAQNEVTQSVLSKIPYRQKIEDR